jgi:hypothetical protein
MDSKLRAKVLTMAAASLGLSLGLSLVGGCGKKTDATTPEGAESTAGSESSCGGGSCGAHKEGEGTEGTAPAEGEAAPAEGEAAPEAAP